MSDSDNQEILEGNRADFAANVLAAFGIGVYVVLAIQILRNYSHKSIRRMQRAHRMMLIYSVIMLILACIWYAVGTAFSEYIDVEVPFQPELARALTSCQPMAVTRTLSHTLMVWLSDGLLVWRTYVIWDGNATAVALPCLIYLTSIGLGIALELSCLGTDLGGPISFSRTVHVALPFYGLSIGLTLVTTGLIAFKLLSHRRRLRRAGMNLGNALKTYASVSNIIIESGLLYTVFGVLYFPLQILDLPASTPIGVIFTCTTFISPALIQLRITEGVAYSEESTKLSASDQTLTLAPVHFQSSHTSRTQYTGSKGTGTWVEKEVELSHDA